MESATLQEINPALTDAEVKAKYRHSDFAGFIESFKWMVLQLQTPDHYALAARRLFQSLEAQRVRYAEVTLSAGVVLWRKQDFGAIYDAVTREAAQSNVEVWWVLDAIRQFGEEHAMQVARLAVERAQDKVVAFGIGGDEIAAATGSFAKVFEFARSHGLALVPHAGETTGAESVWQAVRLHANRIGHGIGAANDPALMRHLRDHDIPLEICISSNVATGAVKSLGEHPVRKLYDAGVPITLNTDDPGIFQTSLNEEYALAASAFGFTESEIRQVIRNGFHYGLRSTPRN